MDVFSHREWITTTAPGDVNVRACSFLADAGTAGAPIYATNDHLSFPSNAHIWPFDVARDTALLAVVLLTYPRRVAHLPVRSRRTLIALRLLSAVVLAFAMFRPAVQFTEQDERGARLVFLLDASRSMTTPDGPKGATRREALVKLLKDHEESLQKIGQQVDLQLLDFGQEADDIGR